jgi:hypothetical protein
MLISFEIFFLPLPAEPLHRRLQQIFLTLTALFFSSGLLLPAGAQEKDETKGTLAEPVDAADVRSQIAVAEKLGGVVPDRGAILYFLSIAKQHLGQTREALSLLKECVALREGFDPAGEPAFKGLKESKEFIDLVEEVHREFPVVSQARIAFVTEEKDLVPEGLAYDARQSVFYLGSLNRRKIVKINTEGRVSDFGPATQEAFLPILGIRLHPSDGTIWANSFSEDVGKTELLHFDASGKLLGRYAPKDNARHGFNDLVVLKNGEIILSDSLANMVWRFDPRQETFSPLSIYRPLLYPNGVAETEDNRQVFVADNVGVVRIDLGSGTSADVNPGPRSTLASADGLYWHTGNLIAIQNGIGSPRVATFRLSKDGSRVLQTTVLENRSPFTVLPTTGAIKGNDFYFIANSQIDNLNGDRVLDTTRLERVRIAVVHLQ